ncbi:MAG: hypothetical protein M0P47_03840 [Bacteroidales bacterium]|nr:hypothetical protein [Bacteroidales bacterium]
MLKKAGHILMIIALLFGTTGLTITRHYCGKNLMHTALYSTPDNCCNGNCPGCHNEKISLKITDQFESTQDHLDFKAGFQTQLEQVSLPTILAFSNSPELSLMNDGSGGLRKNPFTSKPICSGQTSQVLQVFLF